MSTRSRSKHVSLWVRVTVLLGLAAISIFVVAIFLERVLSPSGNSGASVPPATQVTTSSDFDYIQWVTSYARGNGLTVVPLETVWSYSHPICVGGASGWECSWPYEPGYKLDVNYKYLRVQSLASDEILFPVPVGYVMYVPSGMFLTSLPFSAAQK